MPSANAQGTAIRDGWSIPVPPLVTDAGLDGPFEIVVDGTTPGDDPAAAAIARAHEAAGATWWMEVDWANPSPDALRARIQTGPPRG